MDRVRIWERLGRGLRAARPVLIVAAAAFLVAAAAIVRSGLDDHIGRSDLAVVLGTKVERNGQPSPALKARLDEALGLYRRGLFPAIVVSGGQGKEGYDEAAVMKRYLVAQGVPGPAVIADNKGDNTWATARNTVAVMRARGATSVTIVSQYYHLPRSRMAFEKQGVKTIYSAHPDYWTWRDFYAVPREVVGWAAYSLRRA